MSIPILNSLCKTVKYHPPFPVSCFDSIESPRAWMESFTQWYNGKPLHSSLKFVIPKHRHTGEDKTILENRNQLYKQAQERNPKRWSRNTRNCTLPEGITLNPNRNITEKSYRGQDEVLMVA
jgi:putative transposase